MQTQKCASALSRADHQSARDRGGNSTRDHVRALMPFPIDLIVTSTQPLRFATRFSIGRRLLPKLGLCHVYTHTGDA